MLEGGVGVGVNGGGCWGRAIAAGAAFEVETYSKPMMSVCTFLCSSMTRLCEGPAGSSSSGLGFFLLLLLPSGKSVVNAFVSGL